MRNALVWGIPDARFENSIGEETAGHPTSRVLVFFFFGSSFWSGANVPFWSRKSLIGVWVPAILCVAE